MKDEVGFGANRLGAVGATAFGAVWLGAGQSFNREPVVEEAETMEGIPVGGAAGGLLVRDESVTEGGFPAAVRLGVTAGRVGIEEGGEVLVVSDVKV